MTTRNGRRGKREVNTYNKVTQEENEEQTQILSEGNKWKIKMIKGGRANQEINRYVYKDKKIKKREQT